ncbi:hypothetical protein N0V94_004979 [Neodidymelliopsis sp. IMI 364377]|nr:hypothetical protein N0V94_004979 [Neodidymelliopsis sp. IMI 364377]
MTEDSRKELDDAIKSLLSSADHSDLVITCGKDIHKVHKAIVYTRSEFFRRAEGFGKEALEGKIDLPEDEPALISLLMQYLYEGEYEPKLPPPGDLQHIPHKYGVVGLKPLATAKFDRACTYHWDSEHFAPAAYHAFSSKPATDKNLRRIVSKTVAENISLLNKAAVRAVVDEYKEIALDVLELRATDLGWTKT